MQQMINNFLQPRTRLMILLRYVLIGLIAFMGLEQLRLIVLTIKIPDFYQSRDLLEIFLMGKTAIAKINPYLPLDQLSEIFTNSSLYYPHSSPYPPFVAIFSIPLTFFGLDRFFFAWFGFELICLGAIAIMLTFLLTGKVNWAWTILTFFILLATYPVMADLIQGQFGIFISGLLLAAILAIKKHKYILTGFLIGLSISVKIFTWPFLIYLLIKKEWRTSFSTIVTVTLTNLIAIGVLGINPFRDYFFHVIGQTFGLFRAVMVNLSVWAIGYRFFVGTDTAIFSNYLSSPPIVYLPQIAPVVSTGLVIIFTVAGMTWALHQRGHETAFAISICICVAISPVSWDHYYVLIIISLVILYKYLKNQSYPLWKTGSFLLITFLFFFINNRVGSIVYFFNGGERMVRANGNQVSFASSLLTWLPLLELILIMYLLWQSNSTRGDKKLSVRKFRFGA